MPQPACHDAPEPVAVTWTEAVWAELKQAQKLNNIKKIISYGDDCSGARGPLEALQQLQSTFRAREGAFDIIDRFASECPGKEGDGPRKFIQARYKPEIMFDTVHRGSAEWVQDRISNKMVQVPSGLDVYVAGWVCRDVSTMNHHRKPLLPGTDPRVKDGSAGESSTTLESSIEYVRMHRPALVILENLVNKCSVEIVRMAFRRLGSYTVIILLMDSRTMGACMSRRRLYAVAVNTHKLQLVTPIEEWPEELGRIAKRITRVPLEDALMASAEENTMLTCREKVNPAWAKVHSDIRSVLVLPPRVELLKKQLVILRALHR